MGVRILHDLKTNYTCLYCSTTMWAFGGIFYGEEEAEEFLEWCKRDPRTLSDKELDDKIYEFRRIKQKAGD